MTCIPRPRIGSLARSFLLGTSLMMLGTGCRDLNAAHEAYKAHCEQVGCEAPDGGEPDGSEIPGADIQVELGPRDAAVLGECVDVTVSTPEDAAATFSVLPESAPGAELQTAMVFPAAGCSGTAVKEVDVAAGDERTLSFRAYTDWNFADVSERHARELELRSTVGEGWAYTTEVQIENGAFFFGTTEAPAELPPEPRSPQHIRLDGCTKIAGRLFGLGSGRAVPYAPGRLSLLTQGEAEAALAVAPGCSEYWTEFDLSNGAGPVLPSGDELVLYIVPLDPAPACDYWLLGLEGGAEGELQVEGPRELCAGQ
jgi:hypothetical protein